MSALPVKILVAPLDWGLGHTTRCVPIIRLLLQKGVEVILAGNKVQQAVLAPLFPQCRFLYLEGYNVTYSRRKRGFKQIMARQVPGILKAIRRENQWLQEVVQEYDIDGVISDNRYGLYHKNIPCVFMTHQLQILSGNKFVEKILQKINYRLLQRFRECWIPDTAQEPYLAGVLAHPSRMPALPCKYIGLLSRLEAGTTIEKTHRLLILISGPEPQRSIFEKIVFDQLQQLREVTAIVVRGLPLEKTVPDAGDHVTVYNHLDSEALSHIFNKAAYIICRSGYSSVMDIAMLQQKAVLVPTPGQSEQEYLGTYLAGIGFAPCIAQNKFELKKAMLLASDYPYREIATGNEALGKSIDIFISTIKQ